MRIMTKPYDLREWADEQHAEGHKIALVPTMGALHEGHLSLVRLAREKAQKVVCSIFVNPAQFNERDDLNKYPRDIDGDLEKLRHLEVDAVFTPKPATMYPKGYDTYIVPDALAETLCGAQRPGHFRGVCTVVYLLFKMSKCNIAVFGEKDFQQLAIIRRMVRDLWLDIEIEAAPLVREDDGLAMSSRNVLLSPAERNQVIVLSHAMLAVSARFKEGERDGAVLLAGAREVLQRNPRLHVEYLELVEPENLSRIKTARNGAVCMVAATVGDTRLIDNAVLRP